MIAQIAKGFGYVRKNQRMSDAANETHLLRDAETHLGSLIWTKVESIEELSVQYWNLRKLSKERDNLYEKLNQCQDRLAAVQHARAVLLDETPEVQQLLLNTQTELVTNLDILSRKRDDTVTAAREVRRSYDGLKMKLEVITSEKSSPLSRSEVEELELRLESLKEKFIELKNSRIAIGHEIEEEELGMNQVEHLLNEQKLERRVKAWESFQIIGQGNKELSILRTDCGLIDTQMRLLYTEIGRYVSHHATRNKDSAKAVRSHSGLVDVMNALRHSIRLNHQLAGTV